VIDCTTSQRKSTTATTEKQLISNDITAGKAAISIHTI
jgi:hypothetical protein